MKREFKVEVIADSTGKWCGNQKRYDDAREAAQAAFDLSLRWTSVRDFRVVDAATGEVMITGDMSWRH